MTKPRPRLLYVEDKDIFITLAKDALPDYDVVPADTLEKALSLLYSDEPFDGALIDINLNDEGEQEGYEVLEYIVEHCPQLPRIVVTSAENIPGGLIGNFVEKYGVEEILLKGNNTLPTLRKSVAKLLNAESRAAKALRAREVKSRRGLTSRQLEVLRLVAQDKSNKEIGAELFITPRAAETHVSHIAAKLGLTAENGKKVRVALTIYAKDNGLV